VGPLASVVSIHFPIEGSFKSAKCRRFKRKGSEERAKNPIGIHNLHDFVIQLFTGRELRGRKILVFRSLGNANPKTAPARLDEFGAALHQLLPELPDHDAVTDTLD
jgi:hypothetical protein